MTTAQNSAKIVDFNAFKQRRGLGEQVAETHVPMTPMLMWYPVWVFVPQPFPTLN